MKKGEAGYTILEALVAFAILCCVLIPLYAVVAASLRVVDRSAKLNEAALLANSKLDEFAATHDLLPATDQGTFAGSAFTWRLSTHNLPSINPEIGQLRLQSVHLILSWTTGYGEQSVAFDTRHLGAERR